MSEKRSNKFLRAVGLVFRVGLVAACACAVAALAALVFWFRPYAARVFESIGDIDLDSYSLDRSTELMAMDRDTGEWYCYATLHGGENRIEIPFDEMPEDLRDACVAIEDKRFWTHKGVDWMRTAYAAVNMVTGGRVRFGASTITQQLIKNLTLDDDVTTDRKLREICSALAVEQKYGKEDILRRYLNTVYFGHGFWGVEAASRGYFGKPASELSAAEGAALVAITRNPSIYDPYGDENRSRTLTILYEMHDQGYLTDSEYEAARADVPEFREPSGGGAYGWFTDEAIRQVQDDLEAAGYGGGAPDLLFRGGLRVYLTVDPAAQELLDGICSDRSRLPLTGVGENLQGAAVLLDNATGDVAAICGGFGGKEGSLVLDRATQSARQPASALKPLGVYAEALESGAARPWTILEDSPVPEAGMGEWPANDYKSYLGNVTLDRTVRVSSNTIPVKLAMEYGEDTVRDRLGKFGLAVGEGESYVRLALGGLDHGVTPLSMAAAYGALADGGTYREPRFYTRVETSDGVPMLERGQASSRAVSAETAGMLTAMLQGVMEDGTAAGHGLGGIAAAGKTGTSDEGKDHWFCGYTPYYTMAVWCGTDEPRPVQAPDGSNPALAVWSSAMGPLHEGLAPAGFAVPEGTLPVRYCMVTGLAASDACAVTGTAPAASGPDGMCDGTCDGAG